MHILEALAGLDEDPQLTRRESALLREIRRHQEAGQVCGWWFSNSLLQKEGPTLSSMGEIETIYEGGWDHDLYCFPLEAHRPLVKGKTFPL